MKAVVAGLFGLIYRWKPMNAPSGFYGLNLYMYVISLISFCIPDLIGIRYALPRKERPPIIHVPIRTTIDRYIISRG